MSLFINNHKNIFIVFSIIFIIYCIYLSITFLIQTLKELSSLSKSKKQVTLKNKLNHSYYVPLSILVATHNNEDSIIDSVSSLLDLNYKLYEIIVIDDNSTDQTVEHLIKEFHLKKIKRPIRNQLKTKNVKEVYQTINSNIKITLLKKEHGGKADAFNVGINVSSYPYFTCIDSNYLVEENTIENLASPILEEDKVVMSQKLVRVGSIELKNKNLKYNFPKSFLEKGQVLEYDKIAQNNQKELPSFVIFKKDIVLASLGFDSNCIGENFELIKKIKHNSQNKEKKAVFKYQPHAIASIKVSSKLSEFVSTRRKYTKGLLQIKSKFLYFVNLLKLLGFINLVMCCYLQFIDTKLVLLFLGSSLLFYGCLSYCNFIIKLTFENVKISLLDILKTISASLIEVVILNPLIFFANITYFFKKKEI